MESTMHKRISILPLLLFLSLGVLAQPVITLMTFESYTFQDKFNSDYGNGLIEGGFQWGAGIEIGLKNYTAVEVIYQNLKSNAFYQGFAERYEGTLGINYTMIGWTKYVPFHDKISGFGTFNAGAGWFAPSSSLGSETVTKFSLGARLGIRIAATEKVSLRIHTQVFSPVQWAGGGFYLGTGGTGATVSTGSSVYQFNVGGSLNYRLK
jgi:hypothetical protein